MFINYQFLGSCPCVRETSSSIELCTGAAVSPCDCSGGSGCQVCVCVCDRFCHMLHMLQIATFDKHCNCREKYSSVVVTSLQ